MTTSTTPVPTTSTSGPATTTLLCRDPSITCDVNYYGVTDAKGETCCDRGCGGHCGLADCATAMGGEALCCKEAIQKSGVTCSFAGISPCILEPLCPSKLGSLIDEASFLSLRFCR